MFGTALVIGGSGFLGTHLVQHLLDEGTENVRIFDVVPPKGDLKTDSRVKFAVGSLVDDWDLLVREMQGVDCVFHCASPPFDLPDSRVFYQVNVDGTRLVVKACRQAGVKDLRNAREDETPFPERYMDYYTLTKKLQEDIVLQANDTELYTVAIRPHGIFGEGDHTVSQMLNQAKMGKMKAVLGSGSNIVDFTYVRNVTLGHILAASKLGKDSIVNGKAYHITNDEPVPFWVFTGEILNRFGYKAPSTHVPAWLVMFVAYVLQMVSILLSPFVQWKPFLTPFKVALASTDHYYSCDRAKQELGYSPKVSLRKGIDLTCEHFRTK